MYLEELTEDYQLFLYISNVPLNLPETISVGAVTYIQVYALVDRILDKHNIRTLILIAYRY